MLKEHTIGWMDADMLIGALRKASLATMPNAMGREEKAHFDRMIAAFKDCRRININDEIEHGEAK